jgi:hypothetical protein
MPQGAAPRWSRKLATPSRAAPRWSGKSTTPRGAALRWLGSRPRLQELLRGDQVLRDRRTVKPEAQTKCIGEVPFIATQCVGQRGPTQGEREVTAHRGVERTCARAAQSTARAVTGAVKAREGWKFCPYASVGVVSWTGGESKWSRGTHERASTWCLRGMGLGSWRLDGTHAVSARKEEAEALREASLSSSWRRHLGHEATAQRSSGKGDSVAEVR